MHLLKSFLYAVVAFLAAVSIHFGEGGAVLIQLPPLTSVTSHPDLYAAGLLALVEIFGRVFPSTENSTLSAFLMRLLDSCLPNRAQGGGRFTLKTSVDGTLN